MHFEVFPSFYQTRSDTNIETITYQSTFKNPFISNSESGKILTKHEKCNHRPPFERIFQILKSRVVLEPKFHRKIMGTNLTHFFLSDSQRLPYKFRMWWVKEVYELQTDRFSHTIGNGTKKGYCRYKISYMNKKVVCTGVELSPSCYKRVGCVRKIFILYNLKRNVFRLSEY